MEECDALALWVPVRDGVLVDADDVRMDEVYRMV
jgi:hypothetical protein